MSFTAWYYPFFLALVAAVYWQLPQRGRWALLLLASYVFYGYWDVRFLSLIGASTVMDFICGLAIAGRRLPLPRVALMASLPVAWFAFVGTAVPAHRESLQWLPAALAAAVVFVAVYSLVWRQRPAQVPAQAAARPRSATALRFLILQISYNLGLLFFFKYFNFFVDSAKAALASFGLGGDFQVLEVLLPVGISFYTFQSIAYAVDIYRGKAEPVDRLLLFAAFIAFFPQLVAGPIERAQHLLPQLRERIAFEPRFIHEGLVLLLVGWFKKVYVANHCALVADYLFKGSGQTSAAWVLLGTLAFAFQIYGDFSGYTDIARGSARLLGVNLARNFRFPYAARDPSDFWNRWHISLSSWIRDYLYIPLGGNRGGGWLTIRNLYVSMLLAGLWHGAAWTFVLWGAYHASLLVLYRMVPALSRLAFAPVLMFVLTLGGWLIFRAPSLSFIGSALASLAGATTATDVLAWHGPAAWLALHVVPLLVLQFVTRRGVDETSLEHRPWPLRALDYSVLFLLVASSMALEQEFIYFQF